MAEKKVMFEVKGMTCDNCVRHVTQAAQAVDGVREVEVDLAGGWARVEGDFDEKQIVEAIEEEGYDAVAKG